MPQSAAPLRPQISSLGFGGQSNIPQAAAGIMAYLRQDERTKHWSVGFRYAGSEYKHSCKTNRKTVAKRVLATIEETIELLHNGRQTIPDGIDARSWIIGGGKVATKATHSKALTLSLNSVCDAYFKDQLQKATTTKKGEAIHIRHLKKILQAGKQFPSINLENLKNYAGRRLRKKYRGKYISPATVCKELATFRQIWIWAQKNYNLQATCPLLGPDGRWEVHIPKVAERIKFQTWQQ